MKKFIPAPLRLQIRVWQRGLQDWRSGMRSQLANTSGGEDFAVQLEVTQPIPPTSHSENKKKNLAIALTQLHDKVVEPGQILSFWHWIGAPTQQRGYCEGRAIVGDQLRSEVGGGLCQLSGMLYWLGLQAGLEVIERHPHSQDLYTDETRYAPLGSDATVVYGYKDLRLKNSLDTPIGFRGTIGQDFIRVELLAAEAIQPCQVSFETEMTAAGTQVRTLRSWGTESVQTPVLLDQTIYRPAVSGHL